MKGIISYGAYIPYNRLQRKKIGEFFGKPAFGGEKAVAGYDEDSVSMGVEAAIDVYKGQTVIKLHPFSLRRQIQPIKKRDRLQPFPLR